MCNSGGQTCAEREKREVTADLWFHGIGASCLFCERQYPAMNPAPSSSASSPTPSRESLAAISCSSFCHPAEKCSLTGTGICDALRDASADGLICWLENRGYGWSLDHTGRMIEARIWDWPNVIGRYRPHTVEPLADMLRGAMRTMTREQLCKTNVRCGGTGGTSSESN